MEFQFIILNENCISQPDHISDFFLRFIYFRARGHKQKEQKKRERESQAESALSIEPDVGLDRTSLRSRPELKPSWPLNRLQHPGVPRPRVFRTV